MGFIDGYLGGIIDGIYVELNEIIVGFVDDRMCLCGNYLCFKQTCWIFSEKDRFPSFWGQGSPFLFNFLGR